MPDLDLGRLNTVDVEAGLAVQSSSALLQLTLVHQLNNVPGRLILGEACQEVGDHDSLAVLLGKGLQVLLGCCS